MRHKIYARCCALLLRVAADEWQPLILLGYYLGGRLSDMVSLSWDSVELATSTIYYQQGKTRTRVKAPIPSDLEARSWQSLATIPAASFARHLPGHALAAAVGLSRQFARLMLSQPNGLNFVPKPSLTR